MNSNRFIVLASILHAGIYLYAAPEHALDSSWPLHARFHIAQSIFWILGLDLVAGIIGYYKLPSDESWVRWALAIVLTTSHLGYFLSMILIPEGRPPEITAHLALAVPLVLFSIGVFLEFRRK